MKKRIVKNLCLLLVLLIGAMAALSGANAIRHADGSVDITHGNIQTEVGNLYYDLYTPKTATEQNKAPAVLLLHGYQNDHETNAAYAIELARRGVVVMSIDEYGHGFSQPGLKNRGFVNHVVKVNYGEESEEAGTFKKIGSTERYRLLMNFSNLSFFNPRYTTDEAGNVLTDSSCGGIYAYAALSALPQVDPSRMGISGHSMGTWAGWSVAAAYSGTDIEPKATVLQCGELFRNSVYSESVSLAGTPIHFNNVLLLQAKWDEFSYFRDYQRVVDDRLLKSDLRAEFLGTSPDQAAWDTTYGTFNDGSARRMELLFTNHRLTTHNSHGLKTAVEWFEEALGFSSEIQSTDQIAMGKEWLVLLAMLLVLAAILPLYELLMEIPFFARIRQPLPSKAGIKGTKAWWRGAVITMLIAGLTYPFMTQLGHALLPLPENIFSMTVGNGFIGWYSLLILVMIITTAIGWKKAKTAQGFEAWYDIGLGRAEKKDKLSWELLGRSLVLMLLLVGMVYLMTAIAGWCFGLDLRFIWPFFKTFTLRRLGQFCVYYPIFAVFFILNNSKIMASMRTEASYEPGLKGFLGSWWRNALLMVGGVLLIVLIEYIPFFLNIGPGADVLFGSTFGGPFMSLLILFVPQVLVFSVFCTYFYRRSGSVYVGALTVAALAAWIVTGGSSIL